LPIRDAEVKHDRGCELDHIVRRIPAALNRSAKLARRSAGCRAVTLIQQGGDVVLLAVGLDHRP
jgi:hypothetical protein